MLLLDVVEVVGVLGKLTFPQPCQHPPRIQEVSPDLEILGLVVEVEVEVVEVAEAEEDDQVI